MNDFIPVNEPLLDGNEKSYLAECIDSGWISAEGPFVERLERMVAAQTGRCHAIAVCNGSAALELAVKALGIGPGDEVILPSFTIISCAAAIIRSGATPVVVDADPGTWNMDIRRIEEKLSRRTRAVMAVHIYGLPVDMQPLESLCGKFGIAIIEDAAEAIGMRCADRPCGSFGAVSVFSFYPNKHVTTGEGGMLLTDDCDIARRCRDYRNLCFGRDERFRHQELGWNFRMSNLQAAVGVAQMERLDLHLSIKRRIGATYNSLLGNVAGIQTPMPSVPRAENCYWVYGLVIDESLRFDRNSLMCKLADRGIGTRPFFWPIHQQPALIDLGLFEGESCPVTERIGRRGLYLPSGLTLTDEQIGRVAAELQGLLA